MRIDENIRYKAISLLLLLLIYILLLIKMYVLLIVALITLISIIFKLVHEDYKTQVPIVATVISRDNKVNAKYNSYQLAFTYHNHTKILDLQIKNKSEIFKYASNLIISYNPRKDKISLPKEQQFSKEILNNLRRSEHIIYDAILISKQKITTTDDITIYELIFKKDEIPYTLLVLETQSFTFKLGHIATILTTYDSNILLTYNSKYNDEDFVDVTGKIIDISKLEIANNTQVLYKFTIKVSHNGVTFTYKTSTFLHKSISISEGKSLTFKLAKNELREFETLDATIIDQAKILNITYSDCSFMLHPKAIVTMSFNNAIYTYLGYIELTKHLQINQEIDVVHDQRQSNLLIA